MLGRFGAVLGLLCDFRHSRHADVIGGKARSCIRHHPEKLNGFEMWRLLYREYKPDTATRKVGLLERVMDDQLAPVMDFGDWFLRWLDLVGE